MDIIFVKNTGGKTSKIKWMFESNLNLLAFLSASYDFASRGFSPRPHEGVYSVSCTPAAKVTRLK